VVNLECSADGRYLVSLGPSTVSAWDLESNALIWEKGGIEPSCASIHPRLPRAICGLRTGQIVELELASGDKVRSLQLTPFQRMRPAIHSQGDRWVYIARYDRPRLLNWPSAKVLWHDSRSRHMFTSYIAKFSPCGRFLITNSEHNMRAMVVWNASTGK